MVLYKRIVTAVLICVFSLTGFFLSSSSAECFSTVWPHEKSDLRPDPSLVFGRLENGFRYILKKNSEPRDRVAMSLIIQAGSLNENSDQRGIAHFLEHMLFNGSTHFQPGELVKYFQSIGMNFGGDTNAHTGYDETVYDIILPQGNQDDIEKCLLVFSDYARGALLLQSEIDRERGVILAEKRSRDSAGYRAHVKETEFSMQGTIIPERMPIGIIETLMKADRSLMKRFYDDWYRPDNMVLVMVGDFDPKEIQPLVEKRFAGLTGSGDKPSCPDFGRLQHDNSDFFYHHEFEMGHTETSIETLWNVEPEDDSFALEVKELTGYVASKIVQHRLDELARESDTPFTSASIYSGTFLKQISYAEIGAKCDADNWKESLVAIENSLRQALEFGFTEAELQRVKKELLAELDSAVLTANSRNSKRLASSIIRAINTNRVIQSPEQEKELLSPVLIQMRLADVEKRFTEIWSHPTRLVKVTGNAVISEKDPLAVMKSLYGAAAEKKVTAYRGEALKNFPYLHLKDKQPVVSQEQFSDIGAKRFVFANGVVLNLKRTTFEENEIQVSADFGLGKSSEPTPGLSLLTESVVGQTGTATLSKSSLDRIMSGSSVEIGFRVHPASFSWEGKSLNKDMELLFQVLQSVLADPGVDADAFQVSMDRFKQYYEAVTADVRGVMKLQGESFLAGGNHSFGLPSWDAFSQLDREQVQNWFLPAAGNGALEISLVGDFDEQEVLALAEKYFSVLPFRTDNSMKDVTVSFPQGKSLALIVPSSIDKGMLVVAWKTDDFWDIKQTRGLHLLAEIFSDKMRRVIRERLGASYSPKVYNVSSKIYKGYGVMHAVLIVDPGQIAMLKKEVLSIAEELWQGKISEAELERAKGPMLTSLKDMVRTNRYWLKSVLALSARYPQQLQWPTTILSGFSSFSLKEIKALGGKYLNPEDTAIISIVPE
jgi:zinc protease